MNYLTITGTSNVLPNNKAWELLSNVVQIEFGEFGDWVKVFKENKDQPILWVVFLEDIISPDRLFDKDSNSVKNDLDIILQPLISYLNGVMSPTFVAFSSWRPESVVSQAKRQSEWKKLSASFRDNLYNLAEKYPAFHLIDLDEVFSEQGFVKCFDIRNYYTSRCRISFKGIELLAGVLKKVLHCFESAPKKVLVLDCDNTLWGGVVGELGLSGITLGSDGLGQAFSDIQRVAKRLSSQGVLLTLASKNNEIDVFEVFAKHPGMQISKEDLVSWRINWQEKSENIVAMASELDLGIDSFVFWDDNPLERAKMRLALPQVTTPELPQDVTLWPAMLGSFDAFAKFSVTVDDRSKSQQYKQRSAFVTMKNRVVDQTTFLKSITLQPTTLHLSDATLASAGQLCQKTNQFNLRSERHTISALRSIAEDPHYESYLVALTDRFGDHGIVAIVIARLEGESAFLDTFLMSCRIMGRQLEAWILNEMKVRLIARNCQWFLAEYIPNKRNSVVGSFLNDHGMTSFVWEKLPDKHPLLALRSLTIMSGQHYYTDLDKFNIPHLDVFENENI